MSRTKYREPKPLTFYKTIAIIIRDRYTCQFCGKNLEGLNIRECVLVPLGTRIYEYSVNRPVLSCKECEKEEKHFKLEDAVNGEEILEQSMRPYFESFAKALLKKGNFKMRYRETDDI